MKNKQSDSGYGIVTRAVMRRDDLSLRAKTVYAYLCSFAGAIGICYPTQELMCHELHITKPTLQRAIQELINAEIISKKVQRKRGRFANTVYTILRAIPGSADTRQATDNDTAYSQNTYGENTANNNKINNNNFNNNNYINNNKYYKWQDSHEYDDFDMTSPERFKEIEEMLIDAYSDF